MPKHKTTPKAVQNYSPEFKLRVVLEYVRNPTRLKKICKANQISEALLTQWHQEFVERAGQIFAEKSQPLPHSQPKQEIGGVTESMPSDSSITSKQPSWGIRINDGLRQTHLSPSSPSKRPTWLKGWDVDNWEHQRGVAFWDERTQVIEVFYAKDVLPLLEKLRTTQDWQTEGLPIIRHISRRKYTKTPKPKRLSKKKQSEQLPQPENKPECEEIDEERLRLNPIASAEAMNFLTQHETLLKEMAEKDQEQIDEAYHVYWGMVFQNARDDEVKKMDFSTRPLPWRQGDESHTLICELGPYRGTLQLGQNAWYWISYVEQPDKRKYSSPAIVRLDEALAWTEQELLALQKAASEEPPSPPPQLPAKPKMDLTPYQIDSVALEPDQISYRVLIEVEHEPDFFKTMEFSPGEIFRYDEEYPTPRRLSQELNIDPSKATIEWPGGIKGGTYLIYSKATYFQETVVA